MASIREIRKRLTAVTTTRKITRAMSMVASIKMRSAREQILNARPYADALYQIAHRLKLHASGETASLLAARDSVKTVGLVVMGTDKGLCGAFNTNVCRAAMNFIRNRVDQSVRVVALGKKTLDYFTRCSIPLLLPNCGSLTKPQVSDAQEMAARLVSAFREGTIDEVWAVYHEFKNTSLQKPTLRQVIPIHIPDVNSPRECDYLVEPAGEEVLDGVVLMAITFEIWRMVLESGVSEQASRMMAMDAATRNAEMVLSRLTQKYNQARQAAITKELLEVVAGADSMK